METRSSLGTWNLIEINENHPNTRLCDHTVKKQVPYEVTEAQETAL